MTRAKLNEVVPVCLNPNGSRWYKKPYIVIVNGHRLKDKRGTPLRFINSMTAAIAGAKEVDRQRDEKQKRLARERRFMRKGGKC
jgi:hypothetical protein